MGSGLTWNFNRYFCKSCGGDLVSIETKEEWNFITGEIRNRSTSHWSIGLVKIDGKWTWVSGRPLTITKWRDNQQSNNKFEVFIVKVSGGQELSTLPAGAAVNNFICEFPKGRTQLRLLSAQWTEKWVCVCEMSSWTTRSCFLFTALMWKEFITDELTVENEDHNTRSIYSCHFDIEYRNIQSGTNCTAGKSQNQCSGSRN